MKSLFSVVLGLALVAKSLLGAEMDPSVKAKVDQQIPLAKAIAADPVIVAAVKAQNATLPPEWVAMTQEKWKSINMLDPFVKSLAKNAVAEVLRAKKSELVSEAFVSDAAGLKVGFLGKTTYWCHKGKAKHDDPMTGKVWIGEVELDASTGVQELQFSVPVLDGDKPIGSLVIGLSMTKMK